MIKDRIERAETYYEISENLKKGFEWIKNNDLLNMPDGRYEIDENNYANIQSYDTKENAPFEAHRKYIDIQYMINGEERCGIADYKFCSVKEAYNDDKDIEFLNCEKSNYYQVLKNGEFLVFFPHDAHQPALYSGNKQFVKKVIVKVLA